MATAQTVSRKTGAVRVKGGHSLETRAVVGLLTNDYRFDLVETRQDGAEVWCCTGGEEPYKLEARGGLFESCGCPNRRYKAPCCKHMILASVVTGYGLRVAGGVLHFARVLLTNPQAIAEEVAARSQAVEKALNRPAAPPTLSEPETVKSGSPCPQCGGITAIEHESGLRADFLACTEAFCFWFRPVSYDYDLMAWVAA